MLHVAKLSTGEAEEEYVDQRKRGGDRKGGQTRAANMTPEERSRIAQQAAKDPLRGTTIQLGKGLPQSFTSNSGLPRLAATHSRKTSMRLCSGEPIRNM